MRILSTTDFFHWNLKCVTHCCHHHRFRYTCTGSLSLDSFLKNIIFISKRGLETVNIIFLLMRSLSKESFGGHFYNGNKSLPLLLGREEARLPSTASAVWVSSAFFPSINCSFSFFSYKKLKKKMRKPKSKRKEERKGIRKN